LHKPRLDWAAAAAWLLVLAAICLHIRIGRQVWGSDLVGMDDPAHYTTGVMVYELARHLPVAPMAFAQDFYLRFPKVALGHWPPVYYGMQAGFYALAGPTIGSARVLSVLICAVLTAVVFWRVRRVHGMALGALSAACFLALPGVQGSAWLVMSDLLVALFMLLAAMAFADFLDSKRGSDAALFGAWASLAILTKGSGWALGIFGVLTPLLARRFWCFRNKWYWMVGMAVAVVSAPFYFIAQSLQVGYPMDTTQVLSGAVKASTRFAMLWPAWHVVPVVVLLIAMAGGVALFRGGSTVEVAAVALTLSQLLFILFFPLTEEGRYYLPAAAAMMLLFGRGLALSGKRAGPLVLATLSLAACGLGKAERVTGYRTAVDSIPYTERGTVMLVGSDAPGEGAFVAERLEHDRARAGTVLRGSKVLASSTWSGSGYRLIYHDVRAVLDYLHSVPVHYVVIDHAAQTNPHLLLLEEAVQLVPEEFRLAGQYPISGMRRGDVLIYENVSSRGKPAVVRLDMGLHTIERRIE
jgi:hypothetical protein